MFTSGKSYTRREIHESLGGQAQGGISTPAEHPIVLIFTGEQGEQYGYRDGWTEEGIFKYTGEGQHGDMKFIRGNKAIRDHITNGKDLHLFEYVDRGVVRYKGQMVYSGFERRQVPDLDGNERRAIVFELLPIDAFNPSVEDEVKQSQKLEGVPIQELRRRAMDESFTPRLPREGIQIAHFRSAAVRAYVLARADGKCEACASDAPFQTVTGRPYLEPHHIRRLSDGGPDHPAWVAALCPNCHRRAHYSIDKDQFNAQIRESVLKKERSIESEALSI